MIFKTIDDNSTLSGQKIVSVFESRRIAQEKVTASLKKHAAQLEIDKAALTSLEQKVANGTSYEDAYAQSMKRASAAAKEHAVATKGVAGTTDIFVSKQKSAQAAMEATATSSKVATIGVKALKLAFNMFSGIVISFAISKIIEGFQYLAESAERAKEKLENIRTDLSENSSSYESNRKTLEGLRNEYDELINKADKLGGVQNLTNDEYKRYQEIVSQILGITPKLITGWDDEGNAISNKNGLLQQSIDLLDEEYEKSIRNNTTKSKNKDVANGVITKINEFNNNADTKTVSGTMQTIREDFIKEIESSKLSYSDLESLYKYLFPNRIFASDKGFGANSTWESAFRTAIEAENDYDKLAKSFLDKNNPIYNLFSEDAINNMIDNANEYNQEVQRIIDDRETLYQDYKDQLNWNAQATTDNSGKNAYKQLSDESKTALTDYIDNLDYASIKTANDFIDMVNNVKTFTKVLSSSNEFSDYVGNLYTPQGDDESIEDYSKRIREAINYIQKYVEEHRINIPLDFNSVTNDVDTLEKSYENTINRFTEKMDARSAKQLRDAKERNDIALLSELEKKFGITDRNILSNFFDIEGVNTQEKIDYFNEVTKTAKTATEAIEMYKKASFDTSEHSLSDIFELKTDDNTITSLGKISEEIDKIQTAAKGLKEAMDTYNATGVISIDQLQSILSYGDEYLKYITDENGNLVLNGQAIKNVTQARLEELRAKTLENLLSNLENIDNEATAQAYLKSQVLETAQSYKDLTVAKIEAWRSDNLLKARNGETDLTVSTINEVADAYIRQANAINNLVDHTNLASVFETTTSAAKSTETALDRIKNKFQELTDVIGSNLNLIKSQISLLETRGSTVGRAYYDELISQSTEKIKVLTEQYNELRKQFLQTDRGTEEWLELNAAILETQEAIIGAKTDIEGFQNSIDKLHWDELDKIADAINGISDEAGNIVDLLDLDDVLDDNNKFTKDAITALAMYGEQLETAQYLISKYSKEIEYLNGEYTKGTITVEEYNEKMQDLNDKQWKSVDAYNAAKKAIIELRKKGIDEEIDALEELYDARKKAWEQEKDQHDWEKTVSENETNINKLKQQIEELQNDNSLTGIKKRKELEDELKKTESDWEDTLYDHVYDERQDQLDKELEDKKKALEKTLDDEEKLVADSIDLVNKNSTTILDNLNRLSREYGIQMSNSLTEPFTHGENALSHYSTMFSEANSAFTDQLNYTAMGIYQLQLDADNAAVSVVNMFNSANGTLLEQLSLVRQSLQEITDKANEAANAVRNAGVATPTNTTTTASNSTSSTNRSLGDMAHDTSGTTLPNAGTWKNVQNDIEKTKKDLEAIEKQKKVGLVKNTPNKFTTISRGYASGTQSATKGLHPIYEDGVEIIEKDGYLIYPIGAFDGGEKVFNNEQTQRLWELSQNPDVMEKFRQELLNIRPCIDFKFGNTAPVTKTNQNVNVQQHFDALVKVEGDMTPDVLAQIRSDRKIKDEIGNVAMQKFVDSYNTRGYRI